jgi:hypothetical protein
MPIREVVELTTFEVNMQDVRVVLASSPCTAPPKTPACAFTAAANKGGSIIEGSLQTHWPKEAEGKDGGGVDEYQDLPTLRGDPYRVAGKVGGGYDELPTGAQGQRS